MKLEDTRASFFSTGIGSGLVPTAELSVLVDGFEMRTHTRPEYGHN